MLCACVVVVACVACLGVLGGFAIQDLNEVVLAAVMFSLLSLVYLLIARETVGFTLGEAILDVRYHPRRIQAHLKVGDKRSHK